MRGKVISFPLPKDHWLFAESEDGPEEPPTPMRMGLDDERRKEMESALRQAGQYAIRAATANGTDDDYDPDSIIQNLIVGMLGYHTSDGLSHIGEG